MKKKVFISQPMNGRSDEEIFAEREKAEQAVIALHGEEVEFINSFFQGAPYEASPLWFLGASLQELSKADIAYFCGGWEHARGCRIENICALEYGIDVEMEDNREG